ncbi:hypothetical protein BDV12DRAFT_202429 [Aspergillus spectabilis]
MTFTSNQNYTVAPHLSEYNLPFPTFRANNPKYTHFVGGGLIFSRSATETEDKNEKDDNPRVLLLQRSLEDSYPGAWEGPGGSCEDSDETLLAGVAREIFEETGLHVSHFVELIAKDEWVKLKPSFVIVAAKYTFLVEVHEAVFPFGEGQDGVPADKLDDGSVVPGLNRRWEGMVKLDPAEHQAFEWAGEEEVRREGGKFKSFAQQGKTILEGFRILKGEVGE